MIFGIEVTYQTLSCKFNFGSYTSKITPTSHETLARCEVVMVMKIQVTVSWVLTPCSNVVGYQHFGGSFCLYL
jgi:hypothetical protein